MLSGCLVRGVHFLAAGRALSESPRWKQHPFLTPSFCSVPCFGFLLGTYPALRGVYYWFICLLSASPTRTGADEGRGSFFCCCLLPKPQLLFQRRHAAGTHEYLLLKAYQSKLTADSNRTVILRCHLILSTHCP